MARVGSWCGALALALLVMLGAAGGVGAAPVGAAGSWLDQQPIAPWNQAGAPVPVAPAPIGEAATSGRCKPYAPANPGAEERAVLGAGWSLFRASEATATVTLVYGMVAVDGMCRPWQFQVFAFVAGKFAGTLAPVTMDSRTDGALDRAVPSADGRSIAADYRRYAATDPLCCPSGTTRVDFAIDPATPLVAPTEARTQANPSASPAPSPPGLPNTGAGGATRGWSWAALALLLALPLPLLGRKRPLARLVARRR